ncbi:hypothetical protein FOXG_20989 [Fusarium oxysporum f. sp. lycopersici 4287]|nr:hypothetical protein FOXG_20989 [Fusarium oxysporum f. sp. lycopersici 4287]KNB13949.1 hypothetical protein FOXG_20989 [Fusarium oxysporum f. sp. lycopersici 4287]
MLKPTWNGMEWIWIHIMDPYVDFVNGYFSLHMVEAVGFFDVRSVQPSKNEKRDAKNGTKKPKMLGLAVNFK